MAAKYNIMYSVHGADTTWWQALADEVYAHPILWQAEAWKLGSRQQRQQGRSDALNSITEALPPILETGKVRL